MYSSIMSLDGYVADATGRFEWAAPSDEVHAFVNDLERPIGTYLYGRRMYETLAYWETAHDEVGQTAVGHDFAALWLAADKVVYSTTLPDVSTARTRLEKHFDPETVRQLKATSARDLSVGGPNLAAQALKAGLVDQCHLFVLPVVVGGGNPALPAGVRLDLTLLHERRFADGTVYLKYDVDGRRR
jgi:dihydrofolate reductase